MTIIGSTRPAPLRILCTGGLSFFVASMPTYKKPHLTFEAQLDLLKKRGLVVTDDKAALGYLRRIGYYRLSGYCYPFRKKIKQSTQYSFKQQREDTFILGAKFQDVVELYVFDKKLRLLVLDAIERLEVAFRVDIAYLLGEKDPFAQTNPELLHTRFTRDINPRTGRSKYEEWRIKYDNLIYRSREDFVEHYKQKYDLPLPIWIAIELWDFGLLSNFYQGMKVQDKSTIALKYDLFDETSNWQVMESWLRSLNHTRNVVAHHGRLWNRDLVDQPKLPKNESSSAFEPLLGRTRSISRIYIILCILAHFMSYVCPKSSWFNRTIELIDSFPLIPSITPYDMGFPHDWKTHTFWKSAFQQHKVADLIT